MTKKELYKLNFEDAASILEQENNQITTYENLKYFAIQIIIVPLHSPKGL